MNNPDKKLSAFCFTCVKCNVWIKCGKYDHLKWKQFCVEMPFIVNIKMLSMAQIVMFFMYKINS